jgi:hypothetical protein
VSICPSCVGSYVNRASRLTRLPAGTTYASSIRLLVLPKSLARSTVWRPSHGVAGRRWRDQ